MNHRAWSACFGIGLICTFVGFTACGENRSPIGGDAKPQDGGVSGSAGSAGSSSGTSGSGGGVPMGGSSTDGGIEASSGSGGSTQGETIIFAQTSDTLYQLDPGTTPINMVEVGKFDCIGSDASLLAKAVNDIAVDKDGNVWGVTGDKGQPNYIFQVDLSNAGQVKCGQPLEVKASAGEQFFGLTFAPVGLINDQKEVLIGGNTAGELWAIDQTGAVSQHGSFGVVPSNDGNGNAYASNHVGSLWRLSGDMVFLANKGNPVGFATVRDCEDPQTTSTCSDIDTLIEIDLSKMKPVGKQSILKSIRGQILKRNGCQGLPENFSRLFGIAAWNDNVYGFSSTQALVAISTEDAKGCLVQDYPGIGFYGAGVTTLAPIVIPPPK
jgi:hypothetical protein